MFRYSLQFTRLVALVAICSATQPADAQGRRGPAGPQPKRMPFKAEGKVVSTGRGAVQMITSTNQAWIVKVGHDVLVEVKGEAGPEVLRPGSFVRFHADIDSRGHGHGEVEELTIFTTADGYKIGAELAAETEQEPAAEVEAGPDAAVKEPANAERSDPQQDRKVRKTNRYFVAGRIREMRKGKMTVVAGRAGVVRVQVAPTAKVAIHTRQLAVARAGDAIRVDGTYSRPGEANARTVHIQLVPPPKPMDGKRPERRSRTTARRERSKTGDPPQADNGKKDRKENQDATGKP